MKFKIDLNISLLKSFKMDLKDLRDCPLQEYKNKYKVSKDGKIWSNRLRRWVPIFQSKNYNTVSMYDNKLRKTKQFRVDSIVALAFLGPSDKYLNHIDDNKLNDDADNLEWTDILDYLNKKYDCKWKPIESYEKYYISNTGQVWSSYYESLTKQQLTAGYMSVTIGYPKSMFKHVHRLVAKAFCSNPDDKKIVNHIDENKMNNMSINLEWVTASENCRHSLKPRKKSIRKTVSECPDMCIELDWLEGYVITEDGKIYSQKTRRYLKQHLNDNGYYRVCFGRVNYYTHRLVAEAYLPDPLSGQTQVNHKNRNKLDNHCDNLEWTTASENTRHSKNENKAQYKHLQKSIAQIDIKTGETIKIYYGIKVASKITGINSGSICKVCKGISPSAGGFKWKYINE